MEMVSVSGSECEYQVVVDGEVVKDFVSKYRPNLAGDVITWGDCSERCPAGESELLIATYLYYGRFDYAHHIDGARSKVGSLEVGDSEFLCVDLSRCNTLSRLSDDLAYYYVFDGERIVQDNFIKGYDTIGNCSSVCDDVHLLLSTNETETFTYSLAIGGQTAVQRSIKAGATNSLCINSKHHCNVLDGDGIATYSFFRSGEMYDQGLSSDYRTIGSCDNVCKHMPPLAFTQRSVNIVHVLASISGIEVIIDYKSPQYQAACWLINDDLQSLDASSPFLVQRCILALIYRSTNGQNWINRLSFMSGKKECDWGGVSCTNGYVTKINLSFNNLRGQILSEIYSLTNLGMKLYLNHVYYICFLIIVSIFELTRKSLIWQHSEWNKPIEVELSELTP